MPFGFAGNSPIHQLCVASGGEGQGALDRIVFGDDEQLVKGTCPALDRLWHGAGLKHVKNSIAAAWRAGERRIGVVVAYDSTHGFSAHDLWVLRVVGMAAGLVWQYKEAEDELGQTAVRLEEAMAVRRHFLNNIAAGGDEARRRFASALHDDSLQLLTGAELQLERIRSDSKGRGAEQLEQLHLILHRVEDSLRRLLTTVSTEALQVPKDLAAAISERLDLLRTRAGIETHTDIRLPAEIPHPIQVILLRNLGEALANVEKHARATLVTVVAEALDGGVRVKVTDDGAGFVVAEAADVPGHIGLVALRERAQLAGGWCRIESDPGTGSRIEFWVPLS
jgi:signal transduction histidine kinase